MASQEGHSEGLSTRDAAMVVPSESPPFRAGRFKIYMEWKKTAQHERKADIIKAGCEIVM